MKSEAGLCDAFAFALGEVDNGREIAPLQNPLSLEAAGEVCVGSSRLCGALWKMHLLPAAAFDDAEGMWSVVVCRGTARLRLDEPPTFRSVM